MLKRWCCAFALVLTTLAFSNQAHAGMPIKQAGNFGIGLGAGTFATGLSMKYFIESDFSVQGNVGWWRGGWYCNRYRYRRYDCGFYRDALALSADLLLEQGPLVGNQNISLDWEIGGGLGLGLADYGGVGLAGSFVLGLQLNIHAIPIDLVVEYRPGIVVVPDVFLDLVNFTGHIRYYF